MIKLVKLTFTSHSRFRGEKTLMNIICYVDGGYDNKNKRNPYGSIKIYEENSGREIYYSGKTKFLLKDRETAGDAFHLQNVLANDAFRLPTGINSSNECEYAVIIELFKYLYSNKKRFEAITICSDSKLVINQLSGKWLVHSQTIKNYYKLAKELLDGLKGVTLIWVSRNTMVRILGH